MTTMKRRVFFTSAWLLLITVSVHGTAVKRGIAPSLPEPSLGDQSSLDDEQASAGLPRIAILDEVDDRQSSSRSKRSKGCRIVWSEYSDSHVVGGAANVAGSIDSCKQACISLPGCTGVDWKPSGIVKCWIIYGSLGGQITGLAGYTHYEREKQCACDSSPCLNQGICSDDSPTVGEDYTCECAHFFSGKNCETETKSKCFPEDSLVLESNGRRLRMSELAVGDRVLTVDVATGQTQFDDVLAFLHRDVNATSIYVQVQTESGYKVSLTPTHLIYVSDTTSSTDAKMMFADRVRVGQYIFNVGNSTWTDGRTLEVITADKVIWVSTVARQAGGYAPLTSSGTIVVDGILASCYASFGSHQLADLAMTPLKIGYYIQEFFWLNWLDMSLNCDDNLHCYAAGLETVARYIVPESWWF